MKQLMTKICTTCTKVCIPYQKGHLPSLVSDSETIFSSLGLRPNTKFHTSLQTKEHRDDLRDITSQE